MKNTKKTVVAPIDAAPIVQIDPTQFGLTSETASNIAAQFKPMLDKMVELEEEFNRVVQLPVDDPDTEKQAKALLQKYVKVRTGTAAIHKEQKAFYLNGGRFVDGWKNAQVFASQGKEEVLEKIANYRAQQEKLRREQLQAERVELIAPYVEDTTALDLGGMADDVFAIYLEGKKKAYEERIAAEQAAREAEERERQRTLLTNHRRRELMVIWNFLGETFDEASLGDYSDEEYETFKKNASVAFAADQLEREKQRAETQRLRAEQEEKDRQLREAEQAKVRAEMEAARLKREQEEAARKEELARLAAEIAEKEEAERLAKAPIKEQMTLWISSFTIPDSSCSNATVDSIKDKFEAFKKWALAQVESL